MVEEWKCASLDYVEAGFPEIELVCCSFDKFMDEHPEIDAIVSPANAYGLMDGGYDYAISAYFGHEMVDNLKQKIIDEYYGELPVGTSISIDIPSTDKKLICTPTMRNPSKILDRSIVYQCMRTTLMEAEKIGSKAILIPAFGGATGQVPLDVIAKYMYAAIYQMYILKPTELNWGVVMNEKVRLYSCEK